MKKYLFLFFIFLNISYLYSQQIDIPVGQFNDSLRGNNTLRVCFYNVENFFDTEKDSIKNDGAFTPSGSYRYAYTRFMKKVEDLGKVIVAMGGWEAPEIIGICEVENANAIEKLIFRSALNKYKYKYIHYESEDFRGIDVALLYRPDKFLVLYSQAIQIIDTTNKSFKTRNILYVKGISPSCQHDTLHLFVNHWPSRYGGYAQSIHKRNLAASVLRYHIDSIQTTNNYAAILVMGDFNDYPYNESISTYLKASTDVKKLTDDQLINTIFPYVSKNNIGSHKYREHWGLLDQIMVSQSMVRETKGWKIKTSAVIFDADFLLIPDERHMGKKPFRTYLGMKYLGGYSDHLPVFIDIICQ